MLPLSVRGLLRESTINSSSRSRHDTLACRRWQPVNFHEACPSSGRSASCAQLLRARAACALEAVENNHHVSRCSLLVKPLPKSSLVRFDRARVQSSWSTKRPIAFTPFRKLRVKIHVGPQSAAIPRLLILFQLPRSFLTAGYSTLGALEPSPKVSRAAISRSHQALLSMLFADASAAHDSASLHRSSRPSEPLAAKTPERARSANFGRLYDVSGRTRCDSRPFCSLRHTALHLLWTCIRGEFPGSAS